MCLVVSKRTGQTAQHKQQRARILLGPYSWPAPLSHCYRRSCVHPSPSATSSNLDLRYGSLRANPVVTSAKDAPPTGRSNRSPSPVGHAAANRYGAPQSARTPPAPAASRPRADMGDAVAADRQAGPRRDRITQKSRPNHRASAANVGIEHFVA